MKEGEIGERSSVREREGRRERERGKERGGGGHVCNDKCIWVHIYMYM